ncbi:cell division protein SepF [Actinomadura verrucosospora]|uniref:Cell division protein SepF n=1 Tax=Actinomadura verrucosospora TaxID=46165 RepID=A0A7D3W171_ACTVE|nr:cell division protein SepF [Actinomadura verrucosospora]QKG23691.1 cell division protein SepF [Actinomadura verrucosospora]
MVKTLRPRDYNEALHVGHFFRNKGVPVVMDLTALPDDVAKQFVDFAAGLVFGRGGDMDRLGPKVFLLVPAGLTRPVLVPDTSPSG